MRMFHVMFGHHPLFLLRCCEIPTVRCLSGYLAFLKGTVPCIDSRFSFALTSAIVEDDDEILLALAEALGQLVPAVGGPGHAALLLPR